MQKTSCNIMAEGTIAKVFRSSASEPEELMPLLIPVLNRYLKKARSFDGGAFLGELLTSLANCDQGFKLQHAEFQNGEVGGLLLKATYKQHAPIRYALSTGFRKAKLLYIIRQNGQVQIHAHEDAMEKQFTSDLDAYLPHEALQVVVPDDDLAGPPAAKQVN